MKPGQRRHHQRQKHARVVASMAVNLLGAGVLDDLDRAIVELALERTQGNKCAAARLLGVDRKVIERRVARYCAGSSL